MQISPFGVRVNAFFNQNEFSQGEEIFVHENPAVDRILMRLCCEDTFHDG